MNLIILTSQDRLKGDRYRLSGHRADHIRTVLKLAPGDHVEVGLLDGPQGTAIIKSVTEDGVTLAVEEMFAATVPLPTVDLICALPRPQILKKVLQTAAMMGVRHLHFIRANRVERSYFQTPLLQPDNYRPHLIEGLSQGKLTRLPTVSIHERFRVFFEDRLAGLYTDSEPIPRLMLLPDPDSDRALTSLVSPSDGPPESVLVAIGPEGGWVPFEIELMERMGLQRFRLSRFVLRVETAAAAVLAQLELLRSQRDQDRPPSRRLHGDKRG